SEKFDVGVVTAARLSATFPYVTPAARADVSEVMPHVVDGGYYDNYGMATLVEWLDEALPGSTNDVKSVLLIQILGKPVGSASDEGSIKNRGWFYQTFAPLTTLAAVRSTGQIAHNNLEVEFLKQILASRNVTLQTVKFEFRNPDTPES